MRIPSLGLVQRLDVSTGLKPSASDAFEGLLAQARQSGDSSVELANRMAALANFRMMSATMAAFGETETIDVGHDAGLANALGDLRRFMASDQPETAEPEDQDTADIDDIIDKAALTHGVDKDLIGAVIKAESGFDPRATSPKGAMGLMQLMPATARGLGVRNAYDPEENVMAGTRFLKSLLDRYDGDIPKALAAYNWGPGNVDRSPGRLPQETRNYISRITTDYRNRQS